MKTYQILKPFTTRMRRFAAGTTVTGAEPLTPHTHDDLAERGFLQPSEKAPNSAHPAAAPAAKPKRRS